MLLIVALVAFALLVAYYYALSKSRARNWPRVAATVRDIQDVFQGDVVYHKVTVAFDVDGTPYVSTLPTGLQYRDVQIGDPIAIIYDPKNPADCDLP